MISNEKGIVRKSGGAQPAPGHSVPDEEALKKINQFTRRNFTAEELYVFPVALCDNEIDRDGERFTEAALEKLAELFVGKTGIFDHSPQARNQTARIYDCRVEHDGVRTTSAGEPYERLVAQAYLPRTDANAEFIAELEAGIKKEVSVGCAVASVTCSVCGADLKNGSCRHMRGKTYGGVLCCAVLDEPADAYEWSFVAVPAQREAGVMKRFAPGGGAGEALKSLAASDGDVLLTKAQAEGLFAEIACLESEAAAGKEYRESLKKDFLRLGALAQPELPAEVLSRAAQDMGTGDLKHWCASFRKRAGKSLPLVPQLCAPEKKDGADGNGPFRI